MKRDAQNQWTIQGIREAADRHKEIDPAILGMLPEESQELTQYSREYISFLLLELDKGDRELSDIKEALEIYEKNCKDLMFRQNFGLCLTQIRAR